MQKNTKSIDAPSNMKRLKTLFMHKLKEKPDELIIGTISLNGLNDLVKKAADMGIPVLDLTDSMSSPDIAALVAVSFWDMRNQAGFYPRPLQTERRNKRHEY